MYIPKHWHHALPVVVSLIGFYITQHFPSTYDVVITFLVLQCHAAMYEAYILLAGSMYQAYATGYQRPAQRQETQHQEIQEPAPKPDPGFVPLVRREMIYTQIVPLPSFDKERNFAVTLIRMHELDPVTDKHVDLTEDKWVRTKKFIRKEFKGMLEKWTYHGAIARASDKKNAPHVVVDWRKVRLVADGNRLPPPPPK